MLLVACAGCRGDSGAADTTHTDTADAGAADTGAADTGAADTGAADTGATDDDTTDDDTTDDDTTDVGTGDAGAIMCDTKDPTRVCVVVDNSVDGASSDLITGVGKGVLLGFGEWFGFDTFAPSASLRTQIAALGLRNWRLTNADLVGLAQASGARTTFVLGDPWRFEGGGNPADDWALWESYVVASAAAAQEAKLQVDYWDLWNEPNHLWPGDMAQFLELYGRTDAALRSVDPAAKIVLPSLGGIESDPASFATWMVPILDYAQSNGLRPDAIAWHEFEQPENMSARVEQMRDWFAERPSLCNPECPEIHINEYALPNTSRVPAYLVGWFDAFEATGVDVANRACWEVPDANGEIFTDCWDGLNSLFLPDNETPTSLYWLYRAYNEMEGAGRIGLTARSLTTHVLPGRDLVTNEISVLVGHLPNSGCPECGLEPIPLDVVVRDAMIGPVSRPEVEVHRMPYNIDGNLVPQASVETIADFEVFIEGADVAISVPGSRVGDAYRFVIRPIP